MTNEKKERMNELEEELAAMFGDFTEFDDKYRIVNEFVSGFETGRFFRENDRKVYEDLCLFRKDIYELSNLYDELLYKPDKDEKTLDYLFREGMSTEEKLKALEDAWWYATNSGYGDAMANRLMAGEDSIQTQRWEENCKNKWAIDRYYNYLKELSENA